MDFLISPAHAQDAAQADPFGFFLPMIVIFVAFYFLLIRPQQKRQKAHAELVDTRAVEELRARKVAFDFNRPDGINARAGPVAWPDAGDPARFVKPAEPDGEVQVAELPDWYGQPYVPPRVRHAGDVRHQSVKHHPSLFVRVESLVQVFSEKPPALRNAEPVGKFQLGIAGR